MSDEEEWRPVVGYEGLYEVSSLGRVRTVPRVIMRSNGVPQTIPGRIHKTLTGGQGYPRVCLRYGARDNLHYVHRLVAEAFLGPAPRGKPNVLHWNDIPDDNRVENLRWGSQKENSDDQSRNRGYWNAKKTHCPHGHEYNERNTHRDPRTGRRHCRECRKARQRAYALKSKEKEPEDG